MSSDGVELARVSGVDKDGIIESVDKTTQAVNDLASTLNIPAPADTPNPFIDVFGAADLASVEKQISDTQKSISDLIGDAGSKLNIGAISGGGSYDSSVVDLKGVSVDLSGRGLFDMLIANGAPVVVSLIFGLLGFGVLLRGNK